MNDSNNVLFDDRPFVKLFGFEESAWLGNVYEPWTRMADIIVGTSGQKTRP